MVNIDNFISHLATKSSLKSAYNAQELINHCLASFHQFVHKLRFIVFITGTTEMEYQSFQQLHVNLHG
jgi:hypothetical protein